MRAAAAGHAAARHGPARGGTLRLIEPCAAEAFDLAPGAAVHAREWRLQLQQAGSAVLAPPRGPRGPRSGAHAVTHTLRTVSMVRHVPV